MESSNGDFARDINDSDEGIESEDGEDIDGEAFKQLIRWARPAPTGISRNLYLQGKCSRAELVYQTSSGLLQLLYERRNLWRKGKSFISIRKL